MNRITEWWTNYCHSVRVKCVHPKWEKEKYEDGWRRCKCCGKLFKKRDWLTGLIEIPFLIWMQQSLMPAIRNLREKYLPESFSNWLLIALIVVFAMALTYALDCILERVLPVYIEKEPPEEEQEPALEEDTNG